jgi:hypothetical protein
MYEVQFLEQACVNLHCTCHIGIQIGSYPKAKRRAKGEGALWFSQSENCWIAEIILPDGMTRRNRNKKQSVMRDWLHEQRHSIKINMIVESGFYTVNSYFSCIWNLPEVDLVPKTVSTLSSKHLDDLYAKKLSEGLSERSITLIRVVLNQAVRQNLILRNPTLMGYPKICSYGKRVREFLKFRKGDIRQCLFQRLSKFVAKVL